MCFSSMALDAGFAASIPKGLSHWLREERERSPITVKVCRELKPISILTPWPLGRTAACTLATHRTGAFAASNPRRLATAFRKLSFPQRTPPNYLYSPIRVGT